VILLVGDKRYAHTSIEDLSLLHVMALQRELALTDISSCKTWADVRALMDEYQRMEPAERGNHPEALFLLSLTVWAARVASGERIEFLEAVDVPVNQIRFVAEPHDKATEGKAPARTRKAPKASAPGEAEATSD
jgi:hypothetical protein